MVADKALWLADKLKDFTAVANIMGGVMMLLVMFFAFMHGWPQDGVAAVRRVLAIGASACGVITAVSVLLLPGHHPHVFGECRTKKGATLFFLALACIEAGILFIFV